jgi:hypothetical protein
MLVHPYITSLSSITSIGLAFGFAPMEEWRMWRILRYEAGHICG